MCTNISARIAATILLLYCSFFSYGWGVTGHRVVAEIAARHLTPRAKERVQSILNGVSMPMVANWADFIRSDRNYDSLAGWHYINVDDGLTEQAFDAVLHSDSTADIYTKTKFLIARLKNAHTSKDSMRFYLSMLIHLVGDAHQPMHVSRASDRGGNQVYVTWFKDTSNLHKLWDDDLISFQQLSYTEYANALDLPSKKNISTLQHTVPEQWLYESYALSQQLYSEITRPYLRLSYVYNYDHILVLNDRLYAAGIRLAGILNSIFGS